MTVFDAVQGRSDTAGWSRWTFVTAAALGFAAILASAILYRLIGEHGGVNSYALLADAWMHGRFDSPTCFDGDCAIFQDRTYVIFPPVPALLAMPLVALFGPETSGFMVLSALLAGLTAWTWWTIGDRLGVGREARFWLVLALMFGTPAIAIAVEGDRVWFFAQGVALALVSLAILSALDRRLLAVGVLIGLAFLTRQMALFLAPFLFALSRPAGASLIAFDRRTIFDALKLGTPLLAAIGVYCLYNYARFGAPLDTGYAYIAAYAVNDPNFITHRIADIGLFSREYLLSNVFHLFLQGFHADFSGKYMTELTAMDPMGTSLLAASPFVLYAFYAKPEARLWVGLLVIGVIAGITLFYHSNGFSQYNVQRYTLDWLPVLFVLMLPVFAGDPARVAERLKPFKLLVVYAMGLNIAAFAVVALTKGAI